MTPETMAWMDIAEHLGIALQEVQQKTTSTEFLLWKAKLEDSINGFHRQDYYFARISMQLHNLLADKADRIEDLAKFLMKFEEKEEVEEIEEETISPEEAKKIAEERLVESKNHWLSFVGMTPDGKLQTKKPPKLPPKPQEEKK